MPQVHDGGSSAVEIQGSVNAAGVAAIGEDHTQNAGHQLGKGSLSQEHVGVEITAKSCYRRDIKGHIISECMGTTRKTPMRDGYKIAVPVV